MELFSSNERKLYLNKYSAELYPSLFILWIWVEYIYFGFIFWYNTLKLQQNKYKALLIWINSCFQPKHFRQFYETTIVLCVENVMPECAKNARLNVYNLHCLQSTHSSQTIQMVAILRNKKYCELMWKCSVFQRRSIFMPTDFVVVVVVIGVVIFMFEQMWIWHIQWRLYSLYV